MMMSNGKVSRTLCPTCFAMAILEIGWKPPQGIDPRLAEFKCMNNPSCGSFYKIVDSLSMERL